MKTIAIFHPSTELYGADRIMVLAAKALTEYQPVIYLPKRGDLSSFIWKEIPYAKIKIVPEMPIISRAMFGVGGATSTLQKFVKFRKFMRHEYLFYEFEKIYVNTLACAILLPAFKQFNVPVITHVHEILERPKIAAKLTAKFAFRYSEKVISVSKAVQDNLHRLVKNRKAESIIVRNGIPPIPTSAIPEKHQLSFYLFGRIKPEKGQWYLLEALKLIPKAELKDVVFNMVGGTLKGKENLKEELEEKVKGYGLTDVVKFKGFTNDISAEMSKADVCLVPSLMKDPFPTTVLEAMSAGKAVIATDTGGAKEAIKNGETGFIIPPNCPEVLATAIRKLIHNRDLITQIGKNAEDAYQKNFTIKHFNERWCNALNVA